MKLICHGAVSNYIKICFFCHRGGGRVTYCSHPLSQEHMWAAVAAGERQGTRIYAVMGLHQVHKLIPEELDL